MEDRKSYSTAKENEGYVYIAVNKYMPYVVKIGKTVNTDDRMQNLSNPWGGHDTIPGNYEIIFSKKVFNRNIVEDVVLPVFHKCLKYDGYRENKLNTELFLVPSLGYVKKRVAGIISFCGVNYIKKRDPVYQYLTLFDEGKENINENENIDEYWYPKSDLGIDFLKKYPHQKKNTRIIESQTISKNFFMPTHNFSINRYVYILVNEYIPNLIKLGIDSNLGETIKKHSNQTGVPGRYHPVFLWQVKDKDLMYERALLNRFFTNIRKDGFNELPKNFFIVPHVEYAIDTVLSTIKSFISKTKNNFSLKARTAYGDIVDPEVKILWDKNFRPKSKLLNNGKWPKRWWIE